MTITLDEYFASRAFDPGVMAARAWQIERNTWFNGLSPTQIAEPGVSATYQPALPVIGHSVPTPNLYVATVQEALISMTFDEERSKTQLLWDALGTQSLQRAPSLAPLWAELSSRGDGFVGPDIWTDFRKSDLFSATTQSLAKTATLTMRQASRLLGNVVAKGGRWTLRAAGWLLSVRTPTPMGIGIAIVKQVGIEVAMTLAHRGWKGVLSYLRSHEDPPPPPPLPGPWPPTAPPAGGFWPTMVSTRLALEGQDDQSGSDFEFVAFETGLGSEAPPFLARVSGANAMPSTLMTIGSGLYR